MSGITNTGNWTTGVTTVDINNDGLLDIYICKVGNYLSINGKNLLYVNQGIKNGHPVFKEDASTYGLDFKGFSTQSVFFDYDLDDDLDMFLLNHSVHPNRTYGSGSQRLEADEISGDKFFKNIDGKFTDASLEVGIFQGKIGYGLGVSVSDINNDGYPDIYVGNDFFENDYLYLNQGNGTFRDIISSDQTKLGHTSHFSMGNALSDINNDGNPDIISLDMLPEDLTTYKTSGLEYAYPVYQQYLSNGYSPQYMQNTLHLNLGNGSFSEVAHQSGIVATEWSWSPLVADLDNDGHKDVYITNGILGVTNDMDFINFIANSTIQENIHTAIDVVYLDLIRKIPQKKALNYFFKNMSDGTFKNVTNDWSSCGTSFSNGGIYSDLDNDGDLDIVVNNVNEEAFILENKSERYKNSYLKIAFRGQPNNVFGIGAKVKVFTDDELIAKENYTTKGYLSAVDPMVHIGLGNVKIVDSVQIIWSNKSFQTLKGVSVNQKINVDFENAKGNYYESLAGHCQHPLIRNTAPLFTYKHSDFPTLEFNRDPLIPYASTNLGPPMCVTDINNDGMDDLFIGGGKSQESQMLVQQEDGGFINQQSDLFEQDVMSEDVDGVFFDANNDGFTDLLVVSGGNEFKNGKPLNPRLYLNHNNIFSKDASEFSKVEVNASKVTAVDYDNDGDLDVCITSNLVPHEFGVTPHQFIFQNDGQGHFVNSTSTFAPQFERIGNVRDIMWIDLNNDNFKDLIVVGHWMPVSIFMSDGKKLLLQNNNLLSETNGWWNAVIADDFDKDGDIDIVAGNWGLNTRLKPSVQQPLSLYRNDFDDNGSMESVVTYYYQNKETPFASKDELVKQMPFLNKRYLSYADYADAEFTNLFQKSKLQKAYRKHVNTLASCYFENLGNNVFRKRLLPYMAQVSSINDVVADDFNDDGYLDLLVVGNNYEISTQLGKLDASHGTLLLNDINGFFTEQEMQSFDISGPARNICKFTMKDKIFYLVTLNNSHVVFLKKE